MWRKLAWFLLIPVVAHAQTQTITVDKAVVTGANPSIKLTNSSQAALSIYNESGNEQWLVAMNGAAANDNLIFYDRQGTRTLMEFLTSANQVNVIALGSPVANNLTIVPDGDLILNPTGNDVLPTSNYDINLGGLTKKWLSLHAAELWVETLVAQETLATVGGRVIVAPTSVLTRDLAAGATTMYVKHSAFRASTFLILQANGAFEAIKTTTGPTEVSATEYSYTVTRNLDNTGSNNWYAGDAVVSTGVYDAAIPSSASGFIDLYSIQSVKSYDAFAPKVLSKTPYAYWRFGGSAVTGGIGGADADGTIPDAAGVLSASAAALIAQEDGTLQSDPAVTTWLSDAQGGAQVSANPPNGNEYYKTTSVSGSLLSNSLTVVLGAYFGTFPSAGNVCMLVAKGGTADKSMEFGIAVDSSQALQWYQGNGSNLSTVSLGKNHDGPWTMVAVTRSGDGTSTNSIQVTTCTGGSCSSGTPTSATYPASTGSNEIAVFSDDANTAATRCQYQTAVDELVIFDRVLTSTEIANIYSWRTALSPGYQAGPTIVGNRRTGGTNWNDWTEWWAIGNLDGLYGYSVPTAGAAFGDPADVNLTIDATNGIRMREGGYTRAQWASNGDLTIGVPSGSSGNIYISSAGALYARTGTTENLKLDSNGILVGRIGSGQSNVYITSGSVKLRNNESDRIVLDTAGAITVGEVANSKSRVEISSGNVNLITRSGAGSDTTKIQLASSGSISMTGTLTVGTAGAIGSGATSYADGDGYWLEYNSGTPRLRIGKASTGNKILWDGTNLTLTSANLTVNSDGVVLAAGSATSDSQRYRFSGDANCTDTGMAYDTDDHYVLVKGCSFVKLRASGVDYNAQTDAFFPMDGGVDLGSALYPWDEAYLNVSGTGSNLYPLVVASDSQVLAKTTNIADGTCNCTSGCTIVIEKGLVKSCS